MFTMVYECAPPVNRASSQTNILSCGSAAGVLTVDKYEHRNLLQVPFTQNRVWYGDDEVEAFKFILWDLWGHLLLRR